MNEAELYTGSFSLLRGHALFPAFLEQQLRRFQNILNGLEASGVRDNTGRAAIMRTVLAQLEEMQTYEKT